MPKRTILSMKRFIKILFIAIIVLVIFFTLAYIFLAFKGKAIIAQKIEDLTHKKVKIDHVGFLPPFTIHINNLNIENIAKIKAVYVSPSILQLISGHFGLNEIKIINPEITYERTVSKKTDAVVNNASNPTATVPILPIPKTKSNRDLVLISKRLKIQGGSVNFIDRTAGDPGINITIKDISFVLTNIYAFPHPVISNFELKARVPWHQDKYEGKIVATGWVNFFKKDIQAVLKIEDIDGIVFYPYYSNWVDLEKARIEKAKLNFSSQIHGLNNDVSAQCHLELVDIVFKPRLDNEPQEKAEKIATAVIGIFKALNKGNIVLDFTIKTKLDNPTFGFSDIKMAFEEKLAQGRKQDVLVLPVKVIEGAFKGLTDMTTAVVVGTISVGREIGRAVEGAFKKEKKQ